MPVHGFPAQDPPAQADEVEAAVIWWSVKNVGEAAVKLADDEPVALAGHQSDKWRRQTAGHEQAFGAPSTEQPHPAADQATVAEETALKAGATKPVDCDHHRHAGAAGGLQVVETAERAELSALGVDRAEHLQQLDGPRDCSCSGLMPPQTKGLTWAAQLISAGWRIAQYHLLGSLACGLWLQRLDREFGRFAWRSSSFEAFSQEQNGSDGCSEGEEVVGGNHEDSAKFVAAAIGDAD